VISVTNDEFYDRLQQNPLPVVVDFWAPWCGPCRAVEPMLKRAGGEYSGRVDVWKVNADEHPELLRQLHIYGIPTLIGFKSGEEVARQTGIGSPQGLNSLFEAAISGEKPTNQGMGLIDRILRLATGGALLVLAYSGGFAGFYLVLAGLGGLVMFSAVHDRCPVWKAIKSFVSDKTRRAS
jgi:thioredoxin 1